MKSEAIFDIIMMVFFGFGCGALFYWIGVWAQKRKDPMHFWSGSSVDSKTISDIPAYNYANARMWKIYSIPYWVTGVIGLLCVIDIRLSILSMIPIGLACTVGIWWLIHTYRKIEKQYKVQ